MSSVSSENVFFKPRSLSLEILGVAFEEVSEQWNIKKLPLDSCRENVWTELLFGSHLNTV
jgi:hypothetical protein